MSLWWWALGSDNGMFRPPASPSARSRARGRRRTDGRGRSSEPTPLLCFADSRASTCFKMNAPKFGLPARGVVFRTDTALAAELKRPGGLEKGLQAAMLATWTSSTKQSTRTDRIVRNSESHAD